MEIPPEVIDGVSKIGSGLTSGVETAADTFEAIPPEQSLATLGGVEQAESLKIAASVYLKKEKEAEIVAQAIRCLETQFDDCD